MKYIVTVAGREIEVDLEGDQVRVGGRSLSAALRRVPGTPLRHLLVDGRPSTLVIEGNGRGQWTIGVRGERWDVEAVDERTRHIRSLTGAATGDRACGAAEGADAGPRRPGAGRAGPGASPAARGWWSWRP